MGLLDNMFDKDRDGEKKKADFSDVVAGAPRRRFVHSAAGGCPGRCSASGA